MNRRADDRVLLYTYGVIDSTNPQEEMFGNKWLVDAFSRLDGHHMIFLDRLFDEPYNFLTGQSPFDDCTAIVMDFHKKI